MYLTLREYQEEDVVTVKVEKELISNVIEDTYYEFNFASIGKSKNTDIEKLFKSNRLLSVNPTDKIGLDQINENICK